MFIFHQQHQLLTFEYHKFNIFSSTLSSYCITIRFYTQTLHTCIKAILTTDGFEPQGDLLHRRVRQNGRDQQSCAARSHGAADDHTRQSWRACGSQCADGNPRSGKSGRWQIPTREISESILTFTIQRERHIFWKLLCSIHFSFSPSFSHFLIFETIRY